MVLLRSSGSAVPDQQREFSSPFSSIEHGLFCLAQGRVTEGLEILRQIRFLLSAEETGLGLALDALQEASTGYLHAEQLLHEASRRFAAAEQVWQAHSEAVSTLLKTCRAASTFADCPSPRVLSLPAALHPTTPLPETPLSHLAGSTEAGTLPPLYLKCFGHFTVRRFGADGPAVELCRNNKGQAILRYLTTRPGHQATIDTLMNDLWPDEETEVARHKLQVAISALRCSLNREHVQVAGGGYILCKDRIYRLNPEVEIHIDTVKFHRLYQAGQQAGAVTATADYYEQACKFYTGPFLVEDLYAEWSFLAREELTKAYLAMCNWLADYYLANGGYEIALTWAAAILKIDRCDEEAYRQLMRALAATGRRSEALRRYQQCQQALAEELGVQPMPETQQLLQAIIRGDIS